MKVSVIVPAYNCRSTLPEALESVLAQTLPAELIETIVVDDGSTDGSAEYLERMAAERPGLKVLHQPNSGGPGAPRNVGLAHATGEYVFFLDADDRLNTEALARMCAMADAEGTDIVLGKLVGVGGRKVPPALFAETIPRMRLGDDDCRVYSQMTMAPLRLFRRELVTRAKLSFGEGMLAHEDQLFVAGAYLNARASSVLADYDCYFWSERPDGTSVTQRGGATVEQVYTVVADLTALIAAHIEPGEFRDRLIYRHLRLDVFSRVERLYLGLSWEERAATGKHARRLLEEWLTPRMVGWMPARWRVLADHIRLDRETELVAALHKRRRALAVKTGAKDAGPQPAPVRGFTRLKRFLRGG